MPSLEYFLISESVSVDQSTNRVSFFNVIEELTGVEMPPGTPLPRGVIPQLVAASSWNLREEEFGEQFQVTLRAHLVEGTDPIELGQIEFTAGRKRQRVLQVVQGCPVPAIAQDGEMRFEVLMNGNHAASHVVTLTRQAPVPNANE